MTEIKESENVRLILREMIVFLEEEKLNIFGTNMEIANEIVKLLSGYICDYYETLSNPVAIIDLDKRKIIIKATASNGKTTFVNFIYLERKDSNWSLTIGSENSYQEYGGTHTDRNTSRYFMDRDLFYLDIEESKLFEDGIGKTRVNRKLEHYKANFERLTFEGDYAEDSVFFLNENNEVIDCNGCVSEQEFISPASTRVIKNKSIPFHTKNKGRKRWKN